MIVERIKPSVTKIAGLFFFPGKNIIKKVDEAKVKADPAFKTQVKVGIMKIVDIHDQEEETSSKEKGGATEGKAAEIAGVNAKEAIKIIKGIYSIPELEEIAADETRKAVKKEIKAQIKEVKANKEDENNE